jgi:nitrate/nitrite transporter NarK
MMLGTGSFGGIIAPILIGYVLQTTNSFNIAYYIFAAIALIGGILSILIIKKEKEVKQLKSIAAMTV